MITGYDHFVTLADSLQWDETAIDYSADREAWPALEDAENAQVLGLIAGFCIAETSVSGNLGSYQAAAGDDSMEACLRAQARDEARPGRRVRALPHGDRGRGPPGGTACDARHARGPARRAARCAQGGGAGPP